MTLWRDALWDRRLGARPWSTCSDRGFGEKVLRDFDVGWAPAGAELAGAGLAKAGRGPRIWPCRRTCCAPGIATGPFAYFRNRIIFPIRNISRQVAGFGGRVIDQGEPKYLNSSDSSYFSKGKLLYGFDASRMAIAREKTAILVEGYLDLLALAQAGITNVVATCGTAFTPDQARLIRRGAPQGDAGVRRRQGRAEGGGALGGHRPAGRARAADRAPARRARIRPIAGDRRRATRPCSRLLARPSGLHSLPQGAGRRAGRRPRSRPSGRCARRWARSPASATRCGGSTCCRRRPRSSGWGGPCCEAALAGDGRGPARAAGAADRAAARGAARRPDEAAAADDGTPARGAAAAPEPRSAAPWPRCRCGAHRGRAAGARS